MTREEFESMLTALEHELTQEANKHRLTGFVIEQKARDQLWLIVEHGAMTAEGAVDMLRQQVTEAFKNAPERVKGSRA